MIVVRQPTRQAGVQATTAAKEPCNMASDNIKEFTDQNFEEEVLKSEQPVLVDFWAEWCMPCRMLTPTIDKLANDYAGRVKVGKLDTDSNREISIKYGISAIPTVILFKNGQVAQKFVGLRQERDFKEALDASTSPAPATK
jgi:thioredoxin 1